MSNIVNIYDRVKQLSYITSTNDIELVDSVGGFSTFRSVYSHDDIVFYAISDGSDYEVGSGIFKNKDNSYVDSYNYDTIIRNPISSSNNNQKVSFGAGTKEVFVTYPASHSVYIGSGLGLGTPLRGGVAFWDSANVLNYGTGLFWDNRYSLLGIKNQSPDFAVDIGGTGDRSSCVRASGYYVGPTGVYFSELGDYEGGTQYYHFERNVIDTSTAADFVLEVSGSVNEILRFRKQNRNKFLAGPTSGSDTYPTFRYLIPSDIPDISSTYATVSSLSQAESDLEDYTDNAVSQITSDFSSLETSLTNSVNEAISGIDSRTTDELTAQRAEFDAFIADSTNTLSQVCTVLGSGENLFSTSTSGAINYTKFPFLFVETESNTGDWQVLNRLYKVRSSGYYNITASMAIKKVVDETDELFIFPKYRVSTSGLVAGVRNYSHMQSSVPLGLASGSVINSCKTWVVNAHEGDSIYLEYQGNFYNGSSLSIYKV